MQIKNTPTDVFCHTKGKAGYTKCNGKGSAKVAQG